MFNPRSDKGFFWKSGSHIVNLRSCKHKIEGHDSAIHSLFEAIRKLIKKHCGQKMCRARTPALPKRFASKCPGERDRPGRSRWRLAGKLFSSYDFFKPL
jgi:hypothetical protein